MWQLFGRVSLLDLFCQPVGRVSFLDVSSLLDVSVSFLDVRAFWMCPLMCQLVCTCIIMQRALSVHIDLCEFEGVIST